MRLVQIIDRARHSGIKYARDAHQLVERRQSKFCPVKWFNKNEDTQCFCRWRRIVDRKTRE